MCRVHRNGLTDSVVWSNHGSWCRVAVTPRRPGTLVFPQPLLVAPVHQGPSAPLILQQTPGGGQLAVQYHGQLQLECVAQGNPPPQYTWTRDGTVLHGQNTALLVLERCEALDGGLYQCVVSNGAGEVRSQPVSVSIEGCQPRVLELVQQPCSQQQERGGDALFSVEARTAAGRLSYQWYFAGKLIPGAVSAQLVLPRVTGAQEGSYQCRVTVTDARGSTHDELSKEALLKVNPLSDKPRNPRAKIALVIGISPERGSEDKLMCVINDVILVKALFEQLDFLVFSYYDLTKPEMEMAVDMFAKLLNPDTYGVMYLVGHGFWSGGQHYFQPVDAFEGRSVAESCCCEALIQTALTRQPRLLAVFLDICRTLHDGQEEPVKAPVYDTKERGNLIVLYATLLQRRALEPELPAQDKDLHELLMPVLYPDKRGVLTRYLGNVLTRNKYIKDVFSDLMDELRVCPEWQELFERSEKGDLENLQIPSLQNDLLDWRVRLTDPVRDPDYDAVDKWQRCHTVPPDRTECLVGYPILLNVSFKRLASTVLMVTLTPALQRRSNIPVVVTVNKRRMPLQVQMVEHLRRLGGTTPNMWESVTVISRLQRLQTPLELSVDVRIDGRENGTYLFHLGSPLMAYAAKSFLVRDPPGQAAAQDGKAKLEDTSLFDTGETFDSGKTFESGKTFDSGETFDSGKTFDSSCSYDRSSGYSDVSVHAGESKLEDKMEGKLEGKQGQEHEETCDSEPSSLLDSGSS